ncbi:MAG: UDP-N-acetylglucosamine 2-epimerase [Candidatus Pelagibacter sp.]
MKKILFISSSRADYGLLRDVIIQTQKMNKNTFLLVTGSHLSSSFGNTIFEIKNDKIKNIIKKKLLENKFNDLSISKYVSKSINLTAEAIIKKKPNVVVILGDRYELLGSAIAAMTFRIPIAHIHGGEVTYGAYDDSIRHSLTKLSHLHFPIHDKYKKRLIQLGEHPSTIFNYGGLGAHSISEMKLLKKSQLEKKLKISLSNKIVLVTFHPVTLEKNKSKFQIKNLIKFLNTLKDMTIIITSPNFDNENDILKKEFLKFQKKKGVYFFNSLGNKAYISLMKIAYFVIGNSSSGVLETPSFGTPTINIGNRQKGRIISKNIINSDYDYKSLYKAFQKMKKKQKITNNPFLKKGTPTRIAKKILNFKYKIKKKFYDI